TIGIFAATHREGIITDTHFDVVSFTRKDGDGTILRFPAETADGAIVGNDVRVTANSERALLVPIGIQVGANRRVLDAFDQAQSEELERSAESDVVIANCLGEIGLLEGTCRRIGASL